MAEKGRITVIAGVNGAGKSSLAGERLRQRGDPDEVTRAFLDASPSMSMAEANGRAWEEARKRLEDAIHDRADFTFEITLGGATITGLLFKALDEGLEVVMLYVGLDIPESKVLARYTSSLQNLVKLAPRLTELRVLDNSIDADRKTGRRPDPKELLYSEAGRLVRHCELSKCPTWAKPVVAVLAYEAVNPEEYLADVLVRVNTHPASKIDELLPHRWRAPPAQPPAAA